MFSRYRMDADFTHLLYSISHIVCIYIFFLAFFYLLDAVIFVLIICPQQFVSWCEFKLKLAKNRGYFYSSLYHKPLQTKEVKVKKGRTSLIKLAFRPGKIYSSVKSL